MSQINFHTTPEFDAQLGVLMRLKAIPRKSEAIRMAVAAQTSHLRRDFYVPDKIARRFKQRAAQAGLSRSRAGQTRCTYQRNLARWLF